MYVKMVVCKIKGVSKTVTNTTSNTSTKAMEEWTYGKSIPSEFFEQWHFKVMGNKSYRSTKIWIKNGTTKPQKFFSGNGSQLYSYQTK